MLYTVLVADDVYAYRKSIEGLLHAEMKKQGLLVNLDYAVLTASSGDEASKILQNGKNKIDLAILDMEMPPGPDGLTLSMRLHDTGSSTRFVLCSGSIDDEIARFASIHGIGTIHKPLTEEKFLEAVAPYLAKQR